MKILVADDDDELRDLVEMILTTAGYKVSMHENGKTAWKSLQAEGADMAVLDINMPEMDGLELLDLIRGDKRFQDMPVILLTALSQAQAQARGYERGADDYITKPFDDAALVNSVKRLEQAFSKDD